MNTGGHLRRESPAEAVEEGSVMIDWGVEGPPTTSDGAKTATAVNEKDMYDVRKIHLFGRYLDHFQERSGTTPDMGQYLARKA